jgi:L,D-transpeptidase catalytic domain/Putative peptidoglycan binding domain
VRRVLLLAALVLSFPATAQPADGSRLTLTAPGATTFGHRIDFRGRLTPSVRGTRVRLMRGTMFVAAAPTEPGGSFHFAVNVGRPGPYHAEAAGASSEPVTVRIVPFLDTRLVGARVAGSPLRLEAAVRPAYAGRLRVSVKRPGPRVFRQVFGPAARVRLGTAMIEKFRVVVEALPHPGFADVSRTLPIELRPPSLSYGSHSPLVAELARRLHALGYAVRSTTRTDFDYDVVESVYAFEKVQGLPRTGTADAAFWSRLDNPRLPRPRYDEPSMHIEIDKARQVLYLVRDGEIRLISPVSTAGIAGYYTPVGRFGIYRKVPGYDPSPLGILYKPMYFYGGYAIHGNPSVPPYPASHGCIRVPNFVIERLYDSEPYGETVYVY